MLRTSGMIIAICLILTPLAQAGDQSQVDESKKTHAAEFRKQQLAKQRERIKHQEYIQVGRDIESLFVHQLLKDMYSNVEVDPNFGGGYAEEMYRQLLVEELAKQIPKKSSIGIANKVTEDLKKKDKLKANQGAAESR